jgi:hypothetical protein
MSIIMKFETSRPMTSGENLRLLDAGTVATLSGSAESFETCGVAEFGVAACECG